MDDRQAQIKEGAGLEENRINQDLLDFLNKWSGPFLMVVALIVGGFWLKGWLERRHEAYINGAFTEYSSVLAGGNPNPESLRRIADQYSDIPGLADMARLDTAELYYAAAWLGVAPGAELNNDGTVVDEGDLLTDEQIVTYLDSARELFAQVRDSAGSDGRTLLDLSARWGLAAITASGDDASGATAMYEDLAQRADDLGYGLIATAARRRAGGLEDPTTPRLFASDEIPPITLRTAPDVVEDILNDAAADAMAPDTDAAPETDAESEGDAEAPAGEESTEDDAPSTEDGPDPTPDPTPTP